MSYTFGANTTDDMNMTASVSPGNGSSAALVAGWWYPTTLTATRCYWSAGLTATGNICAEVDTTTSDIRMRTMNVTTRGQWLASGANISIDKWWFVAWLMVTDNTNGGAWRVWVGDAETCPVELTVTNPVARSGNFSNTSSSWALGNASATGSLAWQGDIGWMVTAVAVNVGTNNPLGNTTAGSISNDNAAFVYDRWVAPLWLGRPDGSRMVPVLLSQSFNINHMPLTSPTAPLCTEWGNNTNGVLMNRRSILGVNGVTYSDNMPPKRLPEDWPNNLYMPVRR